MKLTAWISTFCLLAVQLVASSPIETIQQKHLDTAEGRSAFLIEKLLPLAMRAEQLNTEIQAQAETIKALPSQDDQILSLTEEMNQKMTQLLEILPVLELAASIDKDFHQLDAILDSQVVSTEQQQVAERIAALSEAIDKL